MLRTLQGSACVLLTAVVLSGAAQAQQPAKRPTFETTKVDGTDNVYIFRYQGHQSMFVVTPAGVIATDPIGHARPQAVTAYIAEIQKITQAPGGRDRIYAPLDTLRLFVGQVLSADRARQDVVGRRLSERITQGQSENALSTGAYCEARQRLPITMASTLGSALGAQLESLAPVHWLWQG